MKRHYFRLNRVEKELLNVVLTEGENALDNASQIETYFDKASFIPAHLENRMTVQRGYVSRPSAAAGAPREDDTPLKGQRQERVWAERQCLIFCIFGRYVR